MCSEREHGGLGLRKLPLMNKDLLGKWIWRFTSDMYSTWKRLISSMYGKEDLGWRSREARVSFGVRFWKKILKESS